MKENSLKIGVGTPTILMIFVVLCMVILSVLSYQEAYHNALLVEKEKEYLENYYEAVESAHEIKEQLKLSNDLGIEEDENTYSYECEIDENKVLYVVVDKSSFEYLTFLVKDRGV